MVPLDEAHELLDHAEQQRGRGDVEPRYRVELERVDAESGRRPRRRVRERLKQEDGTHANEVRSGPAHIDRKSVV